MQSGSPELRLTYVHWLNKLAAFLPKELGVAINAIKTHVSDLEKRLEDAEIGLALALGITDPKDDTRRLGRLTECPVGYAQLGGIAIPAHALRANYQSSPTEVIKITLSVNGCLVHIHAGSLDEKATMSHETAGHRGLQGLTMSLDTEEKVFSPRCKGKNSEMWIIGDHHRTSHRYFNPPIPPYFGPTQGKRGFKITP